MSRSVSLGRTSICVLLLVFAGCNTLSVGDDSGTAPSVTPATVPSPTFEYPPGLYEGGIDDSGLWFRVNANATQNGTMTFSSDTKTVLANGTVNERVNETFVFGGEIGLQRSRLLLPEGDNHTVNRWSTPNSTIYRRFQTNRMTTYGVETGSLYDQYIGRIRPLFYNIKESSLTKTDGEIRLTGSLYDRGGASFEKNVQVTNRTITATLDGKGRLKQYTITEAFVHDDERIATSTTTAEIEYGGSPPTRPAWVEATIDRENNETERDG